MLNVFLTAKFKKDLDRAKRRGYNITLLEDVVDMLAKGQKLDARYKDHALQGKYAGCRECYITPDWLLIYKIIKNEVVLLLSRTGTHSDVF